MPFKFNFVPLRLGRWYTPGEGPMPREEEAVEMFRAASEVLGGEGRCVNFRFVGVL